MSKENPWENTGFQDQDLDAISQMLLESVDIDNLRKGGEQSSVVSVAISNYSDDSRSWGNAVLSGLEEDILDNLDALFRMIGRLIVDSGGVPVAAFLTQRASVNKLTEETEEQESHQVFAVTGMKFDGHANAGYITIPENDEDVAQINLITYQDQLNDPQANVELPNLPEIFSAARERYREIVLGEKTDRETNDDLPKITPELLRELFVIDDNIDAHDDYEDEDEGEDDET